MEMALSSFSRPAEMTAVREVVVVMVYLYSEGVLTLFGLQVMNE